MFGATILVPLLIEIDPSIALFSSGAGTLIFYYVTGGEVPAYLGSSFAFISPIIAAKGLYGFDSVLAGIVLVGVVYILFSYLIKLIGTDLVSKYLPPAVIGPVIISIGLGLAPVAKDMAEQNIFIAMFTLAIALGFMVYGKGTFKITPILLGIIGGYTLSLYLGIVNTEIIYNASWLSLPSFQLPNFSNLTGVSTFLIPISVVTVAEHIGDIGALSRACNANYYKSPGLHKTLLGDGLATMFAGFVGGVPNTTYGENIGVIEITGIKNPKIIRLAAIIVVALSFSGKFSAAIASIPEPVMGGISILLYGMIAMVGVRTLLNQEDLGLNKNMAIASTIVVIGVSGISVPIYIFEFSGMAAGAIIGIILNAIFNH